MALILTLQANEHEEVKCRYDWHQTAANVVIAIYAKMYHYEKSYVKVNPVRLNVCLVFPQQNDAEFKLDLELRGVSIFRSNLLLRLKVISDLISTYSFQIINVSKATVQMLGTKVEITLPKAEPGTWAHLNFPPKTVNQEKEAEKKVEPVKPSKNDDDNDSDLDLDDIQQVRGVRITEA